MITIPVIDISPFAESGPGAQAVVDAVRTACEEHGFFVVAGHGIAPDVNEDLDRACRAFFSRPLQEKSGFTPEDGERKRGWWGVGAMATARSLGLESPPDFMEYLGFGPELPDAKRAEYARRDVKHVDNFFAPNVWPDTEGLRHAMERYHAEAAKLGYRLLRIFATALDLSPDWFDDKFEQPGSSLFVNYYPATVTGPEPGQFRRGQHTDYGALTVLYTDDESGLQVQGPDGEWCDVPVVPGAYVINIGDLMARWSNHRWRSSMHRVVCPADTSIDRLSVPLFFNPSVDVQVQTVPTCLAPGEPPADPVTSGEWIAKKTYATT